MDSTGSVLLEVMERVYPLNYLKQLSNCSPVSSGNISLLKLLHKTMSVQALTMSVLKRALVFPLFASTSSKSEPQVRDETLPASNSAREQNSLRGEEGAGTPQQLFGGARFTCGQCWLWLHKSLQKFLRAWCVLEINITIVGLQENGFGQPGSLRREKDWAESLAKTLWRSSFSWAWKLMGCPICLHRFQSNA